MEKCCGANRLIESALEKYRKEKGKKLRIRYKAGNVQFTEEMKNLIDKLWKKEKKDPETYNDKLYHVQNVDVSETSITLYTIDSSYKEYVGSRDPVFKTLFGSSHCIDPLSIGAVVVTADSKILMGKRKGIQTVGGSKEGPYSIVAGYVQLSKKTTNSPDPTAALYQELFEEASIHQEEILNHKILGLVERSYLAFEVRSKAFSFQLMSRNPAEEEFARLEFVDNDHNSLREFVKQKKSDIMPKCLASLVYFGVSHFGESWASAL